MWGRKDVDRRPEVERLASEVERLFLAMPVADQQTVIAALRSMAEVGQAFRLIPDALGAELGRLVVRLIMETKMPELPGLMRRTSPRVLAEQIVRGAPTLLGPHRDEISTLLVGEP